MHLSQKNLNSVPFNLSIDNGSPFHLTTNKDTIELSEKTPTITISYHKSTLVNTILYGLNGYYTIIMPNY